MTVRQTILDRNNTEAIAQDGVILGAWGPELTLSLLPSQVGVLTLNVPGRANTLSTEIIGNFSKALTMAEKEDQIKALIFRSAKADHFAYGADIKEISQFGTEEVAANHSRHGHKTFQQNLNITKPTVVAIHGPCLGGGLELALCYDKRICSDSPTTMFGLPEVTLGVVPGLGGTQRLPRKIPMKQALEVILMAQTLNVEEALKYTLVDESVALEDLMKRAEEVALELCHSQKPEDKQQYKYEQKYSKETITQEESKQIASALKTFERILKMRVSENYPAPYLAIETIKCGLENGLSEGLQKEIESFGKLASSAVARNLIAFSFNKEIAVQSANRSLSQVGGIKELGVIGAGTKGGGRRRRTGEDGLIQSLAAHQIAPAGERRLNGVSTSRLRRRYRAGRCRQFQIPRLLDALLHHRLQSGRRERGLPQRLLLEREGFFVAAAFSHA